MDSSQDLVPVRTVTVPVKELLAYPSSERATYFRDLLRLEARGYFACRGTPTIAWATVDLTKYSSMSQFITMCRKIHKGNAVRDGTKATKIGYYTKFFDFRSYVPDLVAINRSTPTRQGRPMTPYSQRSVEEHGGYPISIRDEALPDHTPLWSRYFGIFAERPGHRQGQVVANEQLLAYIQLRRYGNFAMYSLIMGHADHLHEGIMHKMHFDLVNTILTAKTSLDHVDQSHRCLEGLQYLGYADFFRIRPGLQLWKRRALFEPIFLQLDYEIECLVEELRGFADEAVTDAEWQLQCARMLADIAYGKPRGVTGAEAARAQVETMLILDRLSAYLAKVTARPPGNLQVGERWARETLAVEAFRAEYAQRAAAFSLSRTAGNIA